MRADEILFLACHLFCIFLQILTFDSFLQHLEKVFLLDQVKLRDELLKHACGVVVHGNSHLLVSIGIMLGNQADIYHVRGGLTHLLLML